MTTANGSRAFLTTANVLQIVSTILIGLMMYMLAGLDTSISGNRESITTLRERQAQLSLNQAEIIKISESQQTLLTSVSTLSLKISELEKREMPPSWLILDMNRLRQSLEKTEKDLRVIDLAVDRLQQRSKP